METAITAVRDNPLLGRKEVEIEIEHDGESTPSEEDVKSRVAAENDLNTDEIEVDSIYTGYGRNVSSATLKVYQDFEYDEDLERNPEEDQVAEQEEVEETTTTDTETTEEEEVEESEDETGDTGSGSDAEYEEIVDNTISDAKDELNDLDDPDYEAALEAEEDNKDRKTFKEWLENQVE